MHADRSDQAWVDGLNEESLLRVHQKLETFEGQSRFTTWAATIAVNAALSELRRRRYQHLGIEETGERADWSEEEDDTADNEQQLELLRRGITEALTERQREAIQAALGGLLLSDNYFSPSCCLVERCYQPASFDFVPVES